MPTKATRPPSPRATLATAGVSLLQTSHVEAQKFTTIGLPARPARLTVPWPVRFGRRTGGAGLSIRTKPSTGAAGSARPGAAWEATVLLIARIVAPESTAAAAATSPSSSSRRRVSRPPAVWPIIPPRFPPGRRRAWPWQPPRAGRSCSHHPPLLRAQDSSRSRRMAAAGYPGLPMRSTAGGHATTPGGPDLAPGGPDPAPGGPDLAPGGPDPAPGSEAHGHQHRDVSGGWLRPAVFGAMAGLAAGAFSMATGEFVSVSSQNELVAAEVSKERRELEANPEAERLELAAVFRSQGVDADLADSVARQVSSSPEQALRIHVRQELGVDHHELPSPHVAAAASLVTFAGGALIPLLPYLLGFPHLAASLVLAGVAAFAGGGLVARVTERPFLRGALRQVLFAGVAAGLTYAIGAGIGAAIG